MKYLRKFDSVSDMETALANSTIGVIGLAYESGSAVIKNKPTPPDPTIPFYINVRGSVTLTATSGLQMSTDCENWTDTVAGELPTGKTYFRVSTDQESPLKPNWTEDNNSGYDIGGNINSLVKVNFEEDTNCYSFYSFFEWKEKLKSAGNLLLPATTLTDYCYASMFQGCTSLTTAPELPATTMTDNCYSYMFQGCTSLTAAPVLPATTLAQGCYSSMFSGCTSLTTAPVLPATTLANECYYNMFKGCTSLTTAPELPATTLAESCYTKMFEGCTSLTTAPELPATTLTDTCYVSMFKDCTSLTTAPALPATTLAGGCYAEMFSGCTSLTTAPELPATTLADECYCYMFCICNKLNYIKCLATDISASECTVDWLYNVSSTGTFVKNPSMSSWSTGTSGIPEGWTVQNA